MSTAASTSRIRPGRPRQARGKRREADLLRAAGEVFAESGYADATTNAIAARAGVSPGTLYQFFPNKEAMAEALAHRYAAALGALHESALRPGAEDGTLEAMLDRIVDPLLRFHRGAPGFEAIFSGSAVSAELASLGRAIHEEVRCRLEEILGARAPGLARIEVRRMAEVSVQVFKAMLPLATAGSAASRRWAACELKTVLRRYLEPALGPAAAK